VSLEVLLFPGRMPYSPQNSPGGSLCAEVVHPGKDFLILGRVWEKEGIVPCHMADRDVLPL